MQRNLAGKSGTQIGYHLVPGSGGASQINENGAQDNIQHAFGAYGTQQNSGSARNNVAYNFVPCQPGHTDQVSRGNGNTHHTICIENYGELNADFQEIAELKRNGLNRNNGK